MLLDCLFRLIGNDSKQRRSQDRRLAIEELESRCVLATDITAAFSYQGLGVNSTSLDRAMEIRFAEVDLIKVINGQDQVTPNVGVTAADGSVTISVADTFKDSGDKWFLRVRSKSALPNLGNQVDVRQLTDQDTVSNDNFFIETTRFDMTDLVDGKTFQAGTIPFRALDVQGGPENAGQLTNAAFSVLDAMEVGAGVREQIGNKSTVMTVVTQADNSKNYAEPHLIAISIHDAYTWDVVIHEYGHMVSEDVKEAKAGDHSLISGNLRNSLGKVLGSQVAYEEGFADFFSVFAQQTAGDIAKRTRGAGDSAYDSFQFKQGVVTSAKGAVLDASSQSGVVAYSSYGEDQELAVARILMDLVDGTGGYDQVQLALTDVFKNYYGSNLDLNSMWSKVMATSTPADRSLVTKVGAIFQEHHAAAVPLKVVNALGQEIPPNQAINNNNPPKFVWEVPSSYGGTSSASLFGQFQIKFLNANCGEIAYNGDDAWLTGRDWSPTQETWEQIVDAGPKYWVVVARDNGSAYVTGDYWSGTREIATEKKSTPTGFMGFDQFWHYDDYVVEIDDHEEEVTYNYVVTSGTAVLGQHFNVTEPGATVSGDSAYGTIHFTPHQTRGEIRIEIEDFDPYEMGAPGDRTFGVELADDEDGLVFDGGGAIRSFYYALSFDGVNPGNEATFNENKYRNDVYIMISAKPYEGVGGMFRTVEDTATAGKDYTSVNQLFAFNKDNDTAQIVTVYVQEDYIYERLPEQFYARIPDLSAGTWLPGYGTATIRIIDNDPIPTVVIDDKEVTVGGALQFYAYLSNPSAEAITVTYRTADGSAIDGMDYDGIYNGTLYFAPEITSADIDEIDTHPDYQSGTKTFSLLLSTTAGSDEVTLPEDNPTGTILDGSEWVPGYWVGGWQWTNVGSLVRHWTGSHWVEDYYVEGHNEGGYLVQGMWTGGNWVEARYEGGEFIAGHNEGGELIPGHYVDGQWIDDHFEGGVWVDGFNDGGELIPGHYDGGTFVAGHYVDGTWEDGHWNDDQWIDGHYDGGTFNPGHWEGRQFVAGHDETYWVETTYDADGITVLEEGHDATRWVDDAWFGGTWIEDARDNRTWVDGYFAIHEWIDGFFDQIWDPDHTENEVWIADQWINQIWIPGHMENQLFVPGHLENQVWVPDQIVGQTWIPDHYENQTFVPGHMEGQIWVDEHMEGETWVAAHWEGHSVDDYWDEWVDNWQNVWVDQYEYVAGYNRTT